MFRCRRGGLTGSLDHSDSGFVVAGTGLSVQCLWFKDRARGYTSEVEGYLQPVTQTYMIHIYRYIYKYIHIYMYIYIHNYIYI